MSRNVLDAVPGYKHCLRDDMESLYYVVLYSGIRWLPHNHAARLGEAIDRFFFNYLVAGAKIVGGGEKTKNVLNGDFTKSFKWEDEATELWMYEAWGQQNLQIGNKGERYWTPENFMAVWTEALKLNPPKANRFEHAIRRGNRDFTVEARPATNSVSSHKSGIVASLPVVRNLKRSFEKIITLDDSRNGSVPVVVASGSSTSSSKRLRQDVPIPDPHNDPFITKAGSQ